jgi:hypothetical protein
MTQTQLSANQTNYARPFRATDLTSACEYLEAVRRRYYNLLSNWPFITTSRFRDIISSPRTNPFPRSRFVPACHMGDQSGSTHCQALFESALQAYENNTGVKLSEHPLAVQLQSCRSIESITTLLQHQARAFNDFRGNETIKNLIETTVTILFTLSGTAALGASIGLVRQMPLIGCFRSLTGFRLQAFPPADAIQAAFAVLLVVCTILSSHLRIL